MKHSLNLLTASLLICGATTWPPLAAQAQATQPQAAAAPVAASASQDADLPRVDLQLKRENSVSMAFEKFNTLLWTLQNHGEGLFALTMKIQSKDNTPLPDPLKLALISDDRYLPLAINARHRFTVPAVAPEQAKGLELVANLPKGSAMFNGFVTLTTPPDQLDLATVRRIVRLGQKLRGDLIPWYVRWMMPELRGITICSPSTDMALEWPEQGRTLRLALTPDPKRRDPDPEADGSKRSCTQLTGQEQWPDTARLVAARGTQIHPSFAE
ncbi:hypothetical protein ACG0Z6_03290 [Roseateles sp. BYS180W]|uniref:Uncharacterized protein n=1 Tax=Roseateles rivi TaxID=3299028 RepID=A0ABW7FSH8_9BURK